MHHSSIVYTKEISTFCTFSADCLYVLILFSHLFRVISRAPGLKLVVETLITSLKPIGNIVLICCAFFIIFGILGVQVGSSEIPHVVSILLRALSVCFLKGLYCCISCNTPITLLHVCHVFEICSWKIMSQRHLLSVKQGDVGDPSRL